MNIDYAKDILKTQSEWVEFPTFSTPPWSHWNSPGRTLGSNITAGVGGAWAGTGVLHRSSLVFSHTMSYQWRGFRVYNYWRRCKWCCHDLICWCYDLSNCSLVWSLGEVLDMFEVLVREMSLFCLREALICSFLIASNVWLCGAWVNWLPGCKNIIKLSNVLEQPLKTFKAKGLVLKSPDAREQKTIIKHEKTNWNRLTHTEHHRTNILKSSTHPKTNYHWSVSSTIRAHLKTHQKLLKILLTLKKNTRRQPLTNPFLWSSNPKAKPRSPWPSCHRWHPEIAPGMSRLPQDLPFLRKKLSKEV